MSLSKTCPVWAASRLFSRCAVHWLVVAVGREIRLHSLAIINTQAGVRWVSATGNDTDCMFPVINVVVVDYVGKIKIYCGKENILRSHTPHSSCFDRETRSLQIPVQRRYLVIFTNQCFMSVCFPPHLNPQNAICSVSMLVIFCNTAKHICVVREKTYYERLADRCDNSHYCCIHM